MFYIRVNNYWLNVIAHFSILTICMGIASTVDNTIHSFIPIRIVLSLIDAWIFPIFKAK